MKNKILILSDYYLPGYKAGGPIRSIKNMINNLKINHEFIVLTRDHDIGEHEPFPTNMRQPHDNIYYLSKQDGYVKSFIRITDKIDYNLYYLNSFFSLWFSILPLLLIKFSIIKHRPVLIAPRGELSKNALRIKAIKKRLFLFLAKRLNLYRNVLWQASNEAELKDIKRIMGRGALVHIAANIVNQRNEAKRKKTPKEAGVCRIAFLSRISKKKNLLYALHILRRVCVNVQFDIYGPVEDLLYWQKCKSLILKLPANINVYYHGEILPDTVIDVLAQHDLFFLPTKNENFGHVIFESLSAGCPVLISDTTPWSELEKYGVGWDISLPEKQRFVDVINRIGEMSDETYQTLVAKVLDYSDNYLQHSSAIDQHASLFDSIAEYKPVTKGNF